MSKSHDKKLEVIRNLLIIGKFIKSMEFTRTKYKLSTTEIVIIMLLLEKLNIYHPYLDINMSELIDLSGICKKNLHRVITSLFDKNVITMVFRPKMSKIQFQPSFITDIDEDTGKVFHKWVKDNKKDIQEVVDNG